MRFRAALIPLTLASLLASPTFAAGTMQMVGHGEIMAAPDTAYVTSGVTSQGTTAKEALDANTKDMSALIATLKAAGIDEKDIQTSGFSVNPNYVYSDSRDANGYQLPPRIVGYTVTNGVTVHVRKLDSLGAILDQSVQVGANSISGITFAIEDPSKLYDEARKAAFSDARHKAELYSDAAGIELGAIASITEGTGYTPPPQPYMMKAMSADAASAPVPVQAGQLTYSIDVNIIWDLEPGR